MFSTIYSQILLYLSIAIILFLPGYFLLLTIFGQGEKNISLFERFILSFGLGLIITDFIAFVYSKAHISITATSSILGSVIFCAVCFGIYKYCHSCVGRNPVTHQEVSTLDSRRSLSSRSGDENDKDSLFSFSKNQFILILLLLFLTIFIKVAYLSGTVAPTATDLGHHTYWIKTMVETGQLPTYDGMPDFIIGEHIALGEMAIISGLSFFSAFPVVFLLLINLLGILTVFLLTLRIFKNKSIAILTLLFLGVLFAVSSPQAKFVSGGVMGNIMGNFLLPLAFYFYYRAMEFWENSDDVEAQFIEPVSQQTGFDKSNLYKNSRTFLSLAVFTTFGLFYTHHLTAFVFLFALALLIPLFLAVNFRKAKDILIAVSKIVFSWPVMTVFFIGLIFFFFVFTPNYVRTSAVGTAVGAPSKSTREGLTLTNLKDSVGEARMALGFLGLILLVFFYRKKNFGFALVAAWAIMLFIMSCVPQILFVNLPSARIGNYMSYPLAILSAYGFFSIFHPDFSKFKKLRVNDPQKLIPLKFLRSAFLLVVIFVFVSGLKDSADAFKKSPDFTPTLETFNASAYLNKNTAKSDIILKDHNYLSGDTWMKLLFMRGYTYPLSRGYFKRYEDLTKPREMCTLYMISKPDSADAEKCFSETRTKYLMVNPKYDSSQFMKLSDFDEIYNSGEVAVYRKK